MSLFSSLRKVHRACPSLASVGVAGLHQEQGKVDRFTLADKYRGLEKNVWVEFIQLALEHQPLNLGQGLPDDLVPTYVVDSLRDVVNDPSVFMHQYTRGFVSSISIQSSISEPVLCLAGSPQAGGGHCQPVHQAAGKEHPH